MLKILVLLPYFNRPNMVRYALHSLVRADRLYSNWHLAFIDDGSARPGRSVVEEVCPHLLDKITFYETGDTTDKKVENTESRYGLFLNKAVMQCESDICFLLCDDDAVREDYLFNLNQWFTERPGNDHCYSHITAFDPFVGAPWDTPHRFHPLNRFTTPIECSCNVDASQVAWRRYVHFMYGLWFPENQTRDLDATFYKHLNAACGLTPFSGFIGQYKGFHEQQLGRRATDVESNWLRDIDLPYTPKFGV